jgi:hypothetical protein
MIYLKFNTKNHTLLYEEAMFENIMTIKPVSDLFYEVVQKTDEVSVPLFRFPISRTVIQYEHK